MFANQTPERLGGGQRRQPDGDAAGRGVARARRCATPSSTSPMRRVRRAATSIWQRTSEGATPLVPLAADSAAGPPHAEQRRGRRGDQPRCRRDRRGDGARARRVHRPRARDGAGRDTSAASGSSTTRRRPTSTRRGARSRASIASWPSSAAATRAATFEDLREPLRARGKGVVAIGEARPLVREALADVVPVARPKSMADAVREGVRAGAAGRRGAARAGVLELRHVRATTRTAGGGSRRKWRRLNAEQ